MMVAIITVLSFMPVAYADDNYSMHYKHARIFGKLVNYDTEREIAVIYGSVYVRDNNYTWQLIKSKKFTEVFPEYESVKQTMITNVGKTVSCEGSLESWVGQNEEVFKARKISPQEYVIETPEWYAFGKTIKTGTIYKYNLTCINDFIDVLAGVNKAEETENQQAIREEFNENWNTKWCLTKNNNVSNELRQGVGGWQIYQGLLGLDNCYIESAVIRKNIDSFMDAVSTGGNTPEKSGKAIMCAYIKVNRDMYGKVISITGSGALYDNIPSFVSALKNPTNLNTETWRLRIDEEVDKIDGKLCWLSGSKVLVYKKNPRTGKKYLDDQYYAVKNCLTREEFNKTLNLSRELIGEGGV